MRKVFPSVDPYKVMDDAAYMKFKEAQDLAFRSGGFAAVLRLGHEAQEVAKTVAEHYKADIDLPDTACVIASHIAGKWLPGIINGLNQNTTTLK